MFESENLRFLSRLFVNEGDMLALSNERQDCSSDEARIAKVADYVELTHYKLFTNAIRRQDVEFAMPRLLERANGIKDAIARRELEKFIAEWAERMESYDGFFDASMDALAA